MSKSVAIAVGIVLLSGLSGCGSENPSPAVAEQPHVARPANPNDVQAWRDYMGKVADSPSGVVRPYKFLVPSGTDAMALEQRTQVEQALGAMAAGNSFPGNVIAIGGADPAKTADVVVAAFGKAKPASLKALTVLYIGDDANQARAGKIISASGAGFRYSRM